MFKRNVHELKVKSIGIDTYRENIIFMHVNCHVCKSEGFKALTRIDVRYAGKKIIATLNVVHSSLLEIDEAGLSFEAFKRLGVKDGDIITLAHLNPVKSFHHVRSKMYGREITEEDFIEIIKDIVAGHYSNIELAAFISACSANNLSMREIISLTKAMLVNGARMEWGTQMVLDKHSIGGLPGNRTSPILVSIVAAAGLTIPKTSSRAITSPAGTADTMETITNVDLSIQEIKQIIEKENGCLVWGGGVDLSPADDILISVERALDIDSEAQMIASVLSKKAAAGSTHVVIDIPVGHLTKVRSMEDANRLMVYFKEVGEAIGLRVEVLISSGNQPIGKGIGPALEAFDVLAVLKNEKNAPLDLKEKSITMAAMLLEMSGQYNKENSSVKARELLESGEAYKKFKAICMAQGGFHIPEAGKFTYNVVSHITGKVKFIDTRNLARIAKLAGAPKAKGAGVLYHASLNKSISAGDVLFTIYAESEGELAYAKEFYDSLENLIEIG